MWLNSGLFVKMSQKQYPVFQNQQTHLAFPDPLNWKAHNNHPGHAASEGNWICVKATLSPQIPSRVHRSHPSPTEIATKLLRTERNCLHHRGTDPKWHCPSGGVCIHCSCYKSLKRAQLQYLATASILMWEKVLPKPV